MQPNPVWLYDRWYGIDARERLRQLALWSTDSVLVYLNCGLPFGYEQQLEEELVIFQDENIIRFWKYENETTFKGAISSFAIGNEIIIPDTDYEEIIRFVDSRLEESFPDIQSLGFENMEGMLLEQVVLRRRFFSQAICGALKANTVADSKDHTNLYLDQMLLSMQINDTLLRFFNAVNVPSLILLDLDSFLALRQRSLEVLPYIVAEIYDHMTDPGKGKSDIVQNLIQSYETELRKLIKTQPGIGAKKAYDAFQDGTVTQIESKLALFLLNEPVSSIASWFPQDANGYCKLALLLLEWKSGKLGTRSL